MKMHVGAPLLDPISGAQLHVNDLFKRELMRSCHRRRSFTGLAWDESSRRTFEAEFLRSMSGSLLLLREGKSRTARGCKLSERRVSAESQIDLGFFGDQTVCPINMNQKEIIS
jgi:hypothetical protein